MSWSGRCRRGGMSSGSSYRYSHRDPFELGQGAGHAGKSRCDSLPGSRKPPTEKPGKQKQRTSHRSCCQETEPYEIRISDRCCTELPQLHLVWPARGLPRALTQNSLTIGPSTRDPDTALGRRPGDFLILARLWRAEIFCICVYMSPLPPSPVNETPKRIVHRSCRLWGSPQKFVPSNRFVKPSRLTVSLNRLI